MERREEAKTEKLKRFAERLKTEGFLYLPAAYAANSQSLLIEERKNGWTVGLRDEKDHLFPMPCLNLEEMYLKCGGKIDTQILRTLFAEYVQQYEKAESEEQEEGEKLAEIMGHFPDNKLMTLLLPDRDNMWEKNFPGRHIGNTYMLYGVCLLKEKQVKVMAVTWELMEKWQVREEILYQAVGKAMSELFPYEIQDSHHLMGGDFYIVGSKQHCFGLGTLLYEESPLKELAEQKKDDLFVFPLSVHEAAVFPASGWQREMLGELAGEISPFGNELWYYSRDLKQLAFTEKEYEKFQILKKFGTDKGEAWR